VSRGTSSARIRISTNSSLRYRLESVLAEVLIEREDVSYRFSFHQGETRAVSEAEFLVCMLLENPPSSLLQAFRYPEYVKEPRSLKDFAKRDGDAMATMDAQECEGLVNHIVRSVQPPERSVAHADLVSVIDRDLVVCVIQVFNCH